MTRATSLKTGFVRSTTTLLWLPSPYLEKAVLTTAEMRKSLSLVGTLTCLLIATAFDSSSYLLPGRTGQLDPTNPFLIFLRRGTIDTHAAVALEQAAIEASPDALLIIQFDGPIRRQWIDTMKALGIRVFGYLPNNAYVVGGRVDQIKTLGAGVRWVGPFLPEFKIDPAFDDETLTRGTGTVSVFIEMLDSTASSAAIDYIRSVASEVESSPRRFLQYIVIAATVPVERLLDIASIQDVLFIGQHSTPELHDERSAQICAGNLSADRSQPSGKGYLEWLASKGLNTGPDFIIDFADSGLDRGSSGLLHPDFLDAMGRSRLTYVHNFTEESPDDRRGHGTLVASLASGAPNSGLTDSAGYSYGLGVAPSSLIGVSRIFQNNGKLPIRLSMTEVVSAAYAGGARVSNNSWGQSGNLYDIAAQEYDALVRDAQPQVPGNQEMTFVFSAGNTGAGGHISSPGTAKNVITVGASENYRPEGQDSCGPDGNGGIGPDGADSALDLLRYSSGGPTADGRSKPDLTAPGTHVYGAASKSPFFFGEGLCPGVPLFQPPGQELYTWSSGTSLAAPHVTAGAALLRQFCIARHLINGGNAPSPALTKAWLCNSASFLSGQNTGEGLPGLRQGWGRLDLGRAFDETPRVINDQETLFTESGQAAEIRGSLADRSKPLRVTIAWTDAPGMLAGAPWVNDLDLEVRIGNKIYLGNNIHGQFTEEGGSPDRRNNIESVFLTPESIPQGFEGNFTVTVRAANLAGNGVPGNTSEIDQDFALVIFNVTDPLDPPRLPTVTAATYQNKTLTIVGQNFGASATVEINGILIQRQFVFSAAANSLSHSAKVKKLKLQRDFDNRLVVIEGDKRSEAFVMRL